MLYRNEEQRPSVLGGRNLGIALGVHVAFFVLFFLFSALHGLFNKKETVIPIDLTVVVNENLDGEENEPPPLNNEPPPEPEPPKPKVETPPEPKIEHVEAVEQVKEPPKKEEKKVEEKPKEKPKEPEPPKKTKEELMKERIEQMRKNAKFVKKDVKIVVKDVPSGNGRTDRKTLTDAQIRDLLNKGYKPGTTTQLATSELQLCLSLIKQAFYDKWDRPPWTDTLKPMVVRVWFGAGGRVINYKLEQGSSDAHADATIMQAARRVGAVPGLTPDFLSKYRTSGIPVRFTVTPQ